MQQMDTRLGALEGAYTQVRDRLNSIDRRLDGIDGRLDLFVQRMDARFNWLTGIVVGTWITTILAMLFHR